jgi:hypothetical protein
MSSLKPTSVRKFLMNVPPPSNEVNDDKILEELNKLQKQKLIKKLPQQEPKPTIAQIIRSNSMKELEKRKSENITTGPLLEIDPKSDRLIASVKKFKKPSCVKKPLILSAAQLSPKNTVLPNTSTPLLKSSTLNDSQLPETLTPRRYSDPSSNNMSNINITSNQPISPVRGSRKSSCVSAYSPYTKSIEAPKLPKLLLPRRSSDPFNNNVPIVDITVPSVGKLKKPSCVKISSPLFTPSLPAEQSPTSPANSINSPVPGRNSGQGSKDVAAEKPKVKVIDDILESIFQSAKNSVKIGNTSPKSESPSQITSSSTSVSASVFINDSANTPANNSPKLAASPKDASPSFASYSGFTGSSTSHVAPHHMKSPSSLPASIERPIDIKNLPSSSVPAHSANLITPNVSRMLPRISPWSIVEQQPSVISQPSATVDSGISLSTAKVSQLQSSPHLSQQANNSKPSAYLPNDSSKPKKLTKSQKKKNRQQRKKEARAASRRHKDFPTNIEDTDFDTLLEYHEKATSSKQTDKLSNQQNSSSSNNNNNNNNNNNSQSLNHYENGSTSKQDNDHMKNNNNNQSSNAASMNASTSSKRSIEDIARESK